MSPPYLFLSDDWVAEARRIREEHAGGGIAVPTVVKLNQVITDVPFSDAPLKAHLDTSSGELVMELGHVDNPDVTITLDYETAKAIFVDGTAQAGMQAFMAGKIKVEGDLAKLISALQQVNPRAFEASEVQRRIKQITVLEEPGTGLADAPPPASEPATAAAPDGPTETAESAVPAEAASAPPQPPVAAPEPAEATEPAERPPSGQVDVD